MSGDPVRMGLAMSINRPGRNATGVNNLTATLEPKRLGLLHDLVPSATRVGFLVNGEFAPAEREIDDVKAAARVVRIDVHVLPASTEQEIDAAFDEVARLQIRALMVASSPYFDTRSGQITALAARHAIPAMYPFREYATAGGLVSYGIDLDDVHRQLGLYTSQILKGSKPGDLPILLPTKFDLVINLKTAKALGLSIPSGIMAIADDVIE
jgi:putative ABC transport system substrate-binding protein